MTGRHQQMLEDRIARLEGDLAILRNEATVYRGALVWLMGVHQLGFDDTNPRRAVLEPLGLSLDYVRSDGSPPASCDLQLVAAARHFIESAYRVFLSRQTSVS